MFCVSSCICNKNRLHLTVKLSYYFSTPFSPQYRHFMVSLDEILSYVLISDRAFCYQLSCQTASTSYYKHQPRQSAILRREITESKRKPFKNFISHINYQKDSQKTRKYLARIQNNTICSNKVPIYKNNVVITSDKGIANTLACTFSQAQKKGTYARRKSKTVNPLNPELNPICYLLALLGAHQFLHVSRIRVKLLTFRRLMSYIYGAPILDVSRSHTTTQHSR